MMFILGMIVGISLTVAVYEYLDDARGRRR